MVVDFIADEHSVDSLGDFDQCGHRCFVVDCPGRVVRRIDHDRGRVVTDPVPDGCRIKRPITFDGDEAGLAPEH